MVWKTNETMAAVPLPSIYEWGAVTLFTSTFHVHYMCIYNFLQLLARLIVRLAKHNIGYIDWSPYIAQVQHTQTLFIIAIYYVYMALLTLFSFSSVCILSLYLHMYVCTLYPIMFSSFSVLSSFCNPMTPLSTFWFLHEHGSLQIFNRILKSFQLPVGPKEYYGEKINKKVFLSPQKAASFIISMMVITSCPCLISY